MTTTTTTHSSSAVSPLPRYRGLRGAVAFGLLVGGVIVALGLVAGGAIWILTKAVVPSLAFAARTTLIAAVAGGGAALSRWLGGAATERLLPLHFEKGDVGAIGLLLGLGLAGYVTEQTAPGSSGALAIGQVVEVAGPTVEGGRFDLADYRGKVVLVDFWATWCGPCVAELPNVRAAYDRYHAEGLEVVSVSFDFERAPLVRFLKTHAMPWPQIFFDDKEARGFDNPIGRRYGIQAIPCLLLIDREGKLAARDLRGDGIQSAVAQALGQPVPWHHGLTNAGARILNWLYLAIMVCPWWLLVSMALGGAVVGALAEVALRRAFRRTATPASGCEAPADTDAQPGRRTLILGIMGGVLLVLITQALSAWVAHRQANPSTVWTYRLDCAALPADDRPLTEWLQSQPGVTEASVRRDGGTVVVVFEVEPNGAPADVMKQAVDFGYKWTRFAGGAQSK